MGAARKWPKAKKPRLICDLCKRTWQPRGDRKDRYCPKCRNMRLATMIKYGGVQRTVDLPTLIHELETAGVALDKTSEKALAAAIAAARKD